MARLLFSLLLLLLAFVPAFAVSPWTSIAEKLNQSTIFIEVLEGTELTGSCTGFMINTEKRYLLTAAHCDGEKLLADGTQTYRVFKDERKDLMVLRASNVDRPALALAKDNPDQGDLVASHGYGFGLEKPMFRIAHISNVEMAIESISGPLIMVDGGFVPGQSGGPVVNENGEVVMIVQRGNEMLGLGVGAKVIRDRVGRYFEDKK
jgi:S1-C subfamily serine protease